MHGWGKKGEVIQQKVSPQKAENINLLPALTIETIDAYIACSIYKGSVNEELYESFIRDEVLPRCHRFPGS